ncbi:MAG: alanine--tRNA ligase, partial [bacterium]
RNTFLEFFRARGHAILPSFSLIPQNDSSILFVAAGMVPFKAEFSGKVKPKYTRISTCQKCFRMDDIENVGYTLRHHTFFEMLGNFSFGDYFKKESIYWAYELLTQVYKIDSSKLWFSVHPEDEEAEKVWIGLGMDSNKIVRLEDNFWGPAGPTGPCGPSTEIFYENFKCPVPSCKPGNECPECEKSERFVEIWNIVFTQYFKEIDGSLSPLPQKNIDTGMGLERLTKILQNKQNQYQTDLFLPLIDFIQNFVENDVEKVYNEFKITFSHKKYFENKEIYKRIVADHLRGAVFLLADGVVPSNDGRGYVLRKLIRRALLYSRLLGIKQNYIKNTVEPVENIFKNVYPEIGNRKDFVKKMLETEENSFNKNLIRGLEYISNIDIKNLSGKDVFFLYDTLGFPVELIKEIAKNQNLTINMEQFNKEMEIQRERSRQKSLDIKVLSVKEKYFSYFVGYQNLSYESKIVGILKKEGNFLVSLNEVNFVEPGKQEELIIVVEETPFYPEGGGQVGDKGKIHNSNFSFTVKDSQRHTEGFIMHIGYLEKGRILKGENVKLEVDGFKRRLTAINHTATHLLHAALRKILGHHVYQSGSLVDYNRLRFDFTHFDNLIENDLKNIEELVNEKILEDIEVEVKYKPLRVALDEGVIALFTEKYPDNVRTVRIGDFSYELCGGTHVSNTLNIGNFKIISAKSIQNGIKRIEAITSLNTLNFFTEKQKIIENLKNITKQEENNLLDFINKKLEENKNLLKSNRELKNRYYSLVVDEKIKALKNESEILEFLTPFEIENEDDFIIIHDIIKTKGKYIAQYLICNKKILVFHKDLKDKVIQKYNISDKLIPFGQYYKVDSKVN